MRRTLLQRFTVFGVVGCVLAGCSSGGPHNQDASPAGAVSSTALPTDCTRPGEVRKGEDRPSDVPLVSAPTLPEDPPSLITGGKDYAPLASGWPVAGSVVQSRPTKSSAESLPKISRNDSGDVQFQFPSVADQPLEVEVFVYAGTPNDLESVEMDAKSTLLCQPRQIPGEQELTMYELSLPTGFLTMVVQAFYARTPERGNVLPWASWGFQVSVP